jgi:hypothetical protein
MPRIKIVDKWANDVGIYVRVEFDYGFKTQLNFNKLVTEEDITRQIKDLYEAHKPENQKVDVKKLPSTID